MTLRHIPPIQCLPTFTALVRLSPPAVPSPHRRSLCWPPGTLERRECAAFAERLQQEQQCAP